MKRQSNQTAPAAPQPQPAVSRSNAGQPNDVGITRVEGYMRIFDPKTGTTIVEGRA